MISKKRQNIMHVHSAKSVLYVLDACQLLNKSIYKFNLLQEKCVSSTKTPE